MRTCLSVRLLTPTALSCCPQNPGVSAATHRQNPSLLKTIEIKCTLLFRNRAASTDRVSAATDQSTATALWVTQGARGMWRLLHQTSHIVRESRSHGTQRQSCQSQCTATMQKQCKLCVLSTASEARSISPRSHSTESPYRMETNKTETAPTTTLYYTTRRQHSTQGSLRYITQHVCGY
jgi:hypothetical protein